MEQLYGDGIHTENLADSDVVRVVNALALLGAGMAEEKFPLTISEKNSIMTMSSLLRKTAIR
ncbi:MAG: hypothetical protein IJB80_05000 [Clostridia bacterium]|nr:hypothetical protein [Clostridia bacterium]